MRSDGLGFGIFNADSDYFLLDAVLGRLRAARAEVARFGWAVDPEGNRFELWEPAEGM